MKNNIQHYILSLLFILVLPLFPLLIDGIYNDGIIRERSLTLAASLYAITKGVTSKEPLVFGLTIIIGIFLTSIYGSIPNDSFVTLTPSFHIKPQTMIIFGILIAHALERYTTHVLNNQPFFTFNKEEE